MTPPVMRRACSPFNGLVSYWIGFELRGTMRSWRKGGGAGAGGPGAEPGGCPGIGPLGTGGMTGGTPGGGTTGVALPPGAVGVGVGPE